MKISVYILLLLLSLNTYAKDSSFTSSVSFVGMSMDYTEYDLSGKILDSEESDYLDLSGIEISLGYTVSKNLSSSSEVELNFMILDGTSKYIGSYIGSGLGYGSLISTTGNTVIDTDITYKRRELFKNSIELNYGIGFGYREWERALSAYQVEIYSWYSIRPFIGVAMDIQKNINFGIALEYQYGLDTKMSLSYPRLDFKLGGADILEVSFPVSYKYDESINLFLEAIWQKQMIIESNVVGGYYEPKSTAYNNYLKFGVGYKF